MNVYVLKSKYFALSVSFFSYITLLSVCISTNSPKKQQAGDCMKRKRYGYEEREGERGGFTLRNCITQFYRLISMKFAEQAISLGILARVDVAILS